MWSVWRTWSKWLLLAGSVTMLGCTKVPVTGRKQFNVIPESVMIGIGRQQFAQTLKDSRVERKTDDATVLQNVGRRISKVANRPTYKWRYALIDEPQVNAWCLPGGYIGFYTGILPVLKNESGMAFVMGHEVGHAVARHSGERLSQQLAVFGGLAGLSVYLDQGTELNKTQRAVLLGAMGAGATVGVILPFSRKHESEADAIGMMYMASAGYPPAESIRVWERMAETSKGASLPPFLSTHPSHERRQKELKEWLPQARKRYERNRLPHDTLRDLW